MGNRIKGRPKKSSIKAAISSNAGSKRKLTRMGKQRQKNKAGLDASYIGRSRCLTILQINLKDFRRLCILKGIYPREPHRAPSKKKGQSYYHIKDIRAIAHEPVLEKFRAFRAFMKKVRRAAGRNEQNEAIRKNSILPEYTLHHLVKERYPRFVDALADLDDALTLTFLFATLPGDRVKKVTFKAKQLAASWGAYCATTCAVTKSFISIKGVYMEALIRGVPVRWIVPHSFTQYIPQDVDFRIMGTFFEFYETLLSFVLYKLYNDIGVRYPLKSDTIHEAGSTSSVLASNLKLLKMVTKPSSGSISKVVDEAVKKGAASITKPEEKAIDDKELSQSVEAVLNQLPSEDEDEKDNDDESVDVAGPLKTALESIERLEGESTISGSKLDGESLQRKRLFAGLTMFLSREIPRGYLELVCIAFGAKVGWEGDDSPISVCTQADFIGVI